MTKGHTGWPQLLEEPARAFVVALIYDEHFRRQDLAVEQRIEAAGQALGPTARGDGHGDVLYLSHPFVQNGPAATAYEARGFPTRFGGMNWAQRPRDDGLPNFVVIGAARCGTTALYQDLRCHPQVWMAGTKELRYFADRPDFASGPALPDPADRALMTRRRGNWERGLDWYRSQFGSAAPARGEASPIYTNPWFAYVAERMAGLIPDAKLIYCIRDPVDAAISLFRLHQRQGLETRPIDRALTADGYYASCSRLASLIEPYLRTFAPERIHFVELEQLRAERSVALRNMFRFLEVEEEFWTAYFERRPRSVREDARWELLHRPWRAPLRGRAALRRRWAKARGLAAGLEDPPPPDVRARLAESLAPEAERLRTLTGRALAAWSI